MLIVIEPLNEAGGATLPVRVKFSVPSTRVSFRMSTKIFILLPLLEPTRNGTSVWDRIKSSPTAGERKTWICCYMSSRYNSCTWLWLWAAIIIDPHVALPPVTEMLTIVSVSKIAVEGVRVITMETANWGAAVSFTLSGVVCPKLNETFCAAGKNEQKFKWALFPGNVKHTSQKLKSCCSYVIWELRRLIVFVISWWAPTPCPFLESQV